MNIDFYTHYELAEKMVEMTFMNIYMIGSHFKIIEDDDINMNHQDILEKVYLKMYSLGRFDELNEFVKKYKSDV